MLGKRSRRQTIKQGAGKEPRRFSSFRDVTAGTKESVKQLKGLNASRRGNGERRGEVVGEDRLKFSETGDYGEARQGCSISLFHRTTADGAFGASLWLKNRRLENT